MLKIRYRKQLIFSSGFNGRFIFLHFRKFVNGFRVIIYPNGIRVGVQKFFFLIPFFSIIFSPHTAKRARGGGLFGLPTKECDQLFSSLFCFQKIYYFFLSFEFCNLI